MKIIETTNRSTVLINQLLQLWEESVTATHTFLSPEEINHIKQYVPDALTHIPVLLVAKDNNGHPLGFMGLIDNKIEMLFIANDYRGQGIGTEFIKFGIENYRINEVTVNEQNPQAKGFYEHMGFRIYKRTELDEQGNPYPILYMKRG